MTNPWTKKLSVVTIRQNTHAGSNVRAYATVALGPLTIRGVKIIQQPGQRAYVRLPDVQVDGRYFAVLECTDPLFREALGDVVLSAWETAVDDE